MGAALAFTAVGPHFVFDDYVLGLAARGVPAIEGLVQGQWDLFTFTTGDPAANRKLMDHGLMLPWWSDETLAIAFFRPLSSLSHRLDFVLWPDAPRLMYLHGLAWLALTFAAVGCLYRRLEVSPALAALAALAYALDDAHGAVVAWMSNRNALIATALGVFSLVAHDEWRRRARPAGALLGPLLLLLALLAGEFALAAVAYLLAYALFLDEGRLARRLGALWPYAAVVAGWGVMYLSSGAQVRGSGLYLSPLGETGSFLRALPERASGLIASVLGPVPADLALLGHGEPLTRIAGEGLVLAAATYALWPALRSDRTARFWLFGMVLSVVPVTASFPSDRLLPFVGVGAMGLVARIAASLFQAGSTAPSIGRRVILSAFVVVHFVLAPLLLPLRSAQMQLVGRALDTGTAYLDEVSRLEERTVVILNAPLDPLASYIQAERAWKRAPRAKHLYWLTSAGSALVVSRVDANTLRVERENGFFSTPIERLYRRWPEALAPGSVVHLGRMSAYVERATPDGRALSVRFRFPEALESSSFVFLVWRDSRYEPLELGRLARPLRLPAEDFGRILARAAGAS